MEFGLIKSIHSPAQADPKTPLVPLCPLPAAAIVNFFLLMLRKDQNTTAHGLLYNPLPVPDFFMPYRLLYRLWRWEAFAMQVSHE